MKLKSLGPCGHCGEPVSELGAYAKLSANKFAHLSCWGAMKQAEGVELERMARAQEEQEKRAREERELLERQAKERAERERAAEVAERERTNRILAAQKIPMPEKIKPEEKKDAEKDPSKDRFQLIELDPE